MAARRALFVPEEMEIMKRMLNMFRKLTLDALPDNVAALCIIDNDMQITPSSKW